MKRSSLSSTMMAAALVFGTLGAASANAHTSVQFSVNAPAVGPAPVYVAPPVYAAPAYAHGHEWRREYERGWRAECRAPRWDPYFRYMPGQTVWRRGVLYMATPLSASVWNVNSPPEWTPNYWVPARCA